MNWSNIDGTWRRISGPGAWAIFAAGSLARRPSSTVTAAGTWPNTIHEPSVSALESARGPITARLATVFASGSGFFSFRSSTIDRWAARRASARCAGVGEDGGDPRLVGVGLLEEPHAAP